ncbi:MAG: 3-oxoadipate enol-lactonase [Alphaproteobacteria bacterium]|nr:3-oxoadipate enol-lactonase [Alphaproteobacteria bacterium]
MKAKINGVSLNYRIEGPEGAPWLVFSNSLATDLSMWDAEAAHYAERFRVLRYDTRGHGGSAATPAPYSLDMLVADALGLLDKLEVSKLIFVGLSLGGMTAMGLALMEPERLHAIAVCAARADVPDGFGKMWDERIGVARTKGMGALVESTLVRWFTPDLLAEGPEFLEGVAGMILSTSVEGYVGCANALTGLAYLPHLDRIKLPTLFVAGANDIAAPSAVMQAMSAKVAGSRFVELSPSGHLINLQQPDRFRETLDQFLAALPA